MTDHPSLPTQRSARGIYPDEFGDEGLFDRRAVPDIVIGDQ
ncbi:hypothetical protein ACT4ML_10115 [Natrinema sp. LN54]